MNRPDVHAMLGDARLAQQAGRRDEAARVFRAVLAREPENPVALNALGVHALAGEDWAAAEPLFRRAIAADPGAPGLWLNLARAHRLRGADTDERRALEGALAIDQRNLMALVRLAELHERRGENARAGERWRAVQAILTQADERTPALDAYLDHARRFVAAQRELLASSVDQALDPARTGIEAHQRRRFDAGVDHMLGRRDIHFNRCAGFHFPFLPADEFFPRSHFPWLADLEAQTATIRAELQALLAADSSTIRPYVAMAPGTPTNKWSALDNRLDWGAYHLWKNGVRDDKACARCPATAAAVEALPLTDIPGRAPTVFFSLLTPGTHLPAHTGVSNVRTVVHLPLIAPAGCRFRVGGETRQWREGEAWAFDDTIEHEAWNDSGALRAVLILDVWNPHLTEVERDLMRSFFVAADAAEVDGAGPRSDPGHD